MFLGSRWLLCGQSTAGARVLCGQSMAGARVLCDQSMAGARGRVHSREEGLT